MDTEQDTIAKKMLKKKKKSVQAAHSLAPTSNLILKTFVPDFSFLTDFFFLFFFFFAALFSVKRNKNTTITGF